jgi:hypothetical protein
LRIFAQPYNWTPSLKVQGRESGALARSKSDLAEGISCGTSTP